MSPRRSRRRTGASWFHFFTACCLDGSMHWLLCWRWNTQCGHTHTYKHLYNTTQQIEPSVTAMQHCETHLTGFSFLVAVFVLVFHCFVLKFIRCCSAIIHPVESCYWNVCYMLTQTHTHTYIYCIPLCSMTLLCRTVLICVALWAFLSVFLH